MTSLLLLLGIGVIAFLASRQIQQRVMNEALSRVGFDLSTTAAMYDKELRLTAERLRFASEEIPGICAAQGDPTGLRQLRAQLGFAVLNCIGPRGGPLLGSFAAPDQGVPVETDPVLRRALSGELSWGTVRFDAERLRLEGGDALATSQIVAPPPDDPDGGTNEALLRWFAAPLQDDAGRVAAVLYGGQPINHDYDIVDGFVDDLFGTNLYDGKPVGTVTIFLHDTRVATNVTGPSGRRAVGSRVSDEVRLEVLEAGRRWSDRAWVVDAWYISGYEPIRDPGGETIGMLYVGLLEAPYRAQGTQMLRSLALVAAALLVVSIVATVLIVSRITRPLQDLQEGAARIEKGHWDAEVEAQDSYREINELADALHRMQGAIQRRDKELRSVNAELVEINTELERVNTNYMNTLGFVTHELKGPLANIQSLSSLILDGYLGEVPAKALETLRRIHRNAEELQDMVRDYLDLSRAERDGLEVEIRPIDFVTDVVEPSRAQVEGLFGSRGIELQISAPDSLPVEADPSLLRIALTNFLTNAAKYGRSEGRAVLTARSRDGRLETDVWNEGAGFTNEEHSALFQKFSRLQNDNTKTKKGSGLGLYLAQQIVERHGGETWAESEPGEWARFGLRVPLERPPGESSP